VDRLTKQLTRSGVAAAAIHGGRSQNERERALAAFRAGRVRVLVATDVAARGIHVDAVSRVVHFDLPADAKDYIHRSGRTARAGADGAVISLVLPDQKQKANLIRRDLKLDAQSSTKTAHHRSPGRGRVALPAPEPAPQGHQRPNRNRAGGGPRPGAERRSNRRPGRGPQSNNDRGR
jgi:superfamily II DNA/RNA helicase